MHPVASKRLTVLTLLYMTASLIHFIHNAEFLADYPNLPDTWTRAGVYSAWLGMATLGAVGLLLALRGVSMTGLLLIAVFSILGMDSIGHYVVAPISAHAAAMNATILLEVCAAALVFIEVVRQVFALMHSKRASRQRS